MNDRDRLAICQLLLKKTEGTISPEESDALYRQLDDNPDVLDLYVDLALLFSSLSKPGKASILDVMSQKPASDQLDMLLLELSRAEKEAEPVVIEDVKDKHRDLIQKVQRKPAVYHINKTSVLSFIVSAAAILTLVLFLRFAPVPSGTPVAVLLRTVGAEWTQAQADALWEGCDLYAGPLMLVKGYAEIHTGAGTAIILQAPVELDLESKAQLVLHRGRVTVKITQGDNQYVVRTPTASVIDFGTEFGVYVNENYRTLTHVYEGQVELRSGSNPLRVDHVLKLTKGQGAEADSDGKLRLKDKISDLFVRSEEFEVKVAAAEGSGYQRWLAYSYELRRDPDLVLYYPFLNANQSDESVKNYAPAGISLNGTLGGSYGISKFKAPSWTQGRWEEKGALRFDRDERHCITVASNPVLNPGGDITLAVWVHCPESEKGGHLLSSRQGQAVNYQFGCFSSDDPYYPGQLQFLKSDKATSEIYTAERYEWTSEWTLLAVTHDRQTVRFYVNGRLFESVPFVTNWSPVGADLFIGDVPAIDGKTFGYAAFNGLIDEIAVFRRALSAEEIQTMYQAGTP